MSPLLQQWFGVCSDLVKYTAAAARAAAVSPAKSEPGAEAVMDQEGLGVDGA